MTACTYCPHHCEIPEGGTGRCSMYTVTDGEITERFPDSWLIVTPISVETVPFLHAWPRAKALQISTIGCNLTCPGCVSEVLVRSPDTLGTGLKHRDARSILEEAEREHCEGIIFCLNEPTVSLPSFLRVARLAKEKGLFVACSTNGYFSEETLEQLIPVLDAVNIGLKGIDPTHLRSCGILDRTIVMRNISRLVNSGIHVEMALMHTVGQEDDLVSQAREIISLSDSIPIQIMRGMAFGTLGENSEPAIPDSERLADRIRSFASHVYLFNSPGSTFLNSICPVCGEVIAEREMYGPMGCRPLSFRENGRCTCGYQLPITGSIRQTRYEEIGMNGGYRPTRALEFIQGIVSCLGTEDPSCAPDLWRSFMAGDGLHRIHDRIQGISSYYGIIKEVAGLIGREERGDELIGAMEEMHDRVICAVAGAQRPRVFFSMGYPLFAINAERFENQLVECAGGEPVNRVLERTGKPGVTLSRDEFLSLNPDWICISGLFSLPKEECIRYCMENELPVPAIKQKQVIKMPASWDFGSPRWILGMMLLAKAFHPDRCPWDIHTEADTFYRRFYGVSFDSVLPTRSFIKASAR